MCAFLADVAVSSVSHCEMWGSSLKTGIFVKMDGAVFVLTSRPIDVLLHGDDNYVIPCLYISNVA